MRLPAVRCQRLLVPPDKHLADKHLADKHLADKHLATIIVAKVYGLR
jgi:hypothetical protein